MSNTSDWIRQQYKTMMANGKKAMGMCGASTLLQMYVCYSAEQKVLQREILNKSSIPVLADHKLLYVLRAHTWNTQIEQMHHKMQRDLGADAVWILYDESKVEFPHTNNSQQQSMKNIFIINEERCRNDNPLHRDIYSTVESCLMLFYKELQRLAVEYDSMYMIEYDVRCHGNWQTALLKQIQPLDFGATHVERYTEKKNDSWHFFKYGQWKVSSLPSAQVLRDFTVRKKLWYKSFFPVVLISRRFLERFSTRYYRKITAFCELLLPTLCANDDEIQMTVGNLSPTMFGKQFGFGYSFSSEQFQAMVRSRPDVDHCLYHPVK